MVSDIIVLAYLTRQGWAKGCTGDVWTCWLL